jgi:hypothetical protein
MVPRSLSRRRRRRQPQPLLRPVPGDQLSLLSLLFTGNYQRRTFFSGRNPRLSATRRTKKQRVI